MKDLDYVRQILQFVFFEVTADHIKAQNTPKGLAESVSYLTNSLIVFVADTIKDMCAALEMKGVRAEKLYPILMDQATRKILEIDFKGSNAHKFMRAVYAAMQQDENRYLN